MGQQQRSNGWRIVSFAWLKNPPGVFAGLIYLFAFLLIVFTIGVGLITFVRLSIEIVFGDWGSLLQTKGGGVGSGGSPLTVFFAALAALIGGPIVIWRVFTAHVQAQAARHQADTAQEGQFTNLFTKAVELLGATREVKKTIEVEKGGAKERELVTETEPNLEVRLGAIYALDRIARDSERDHWPIMEVLCAYVRNPQNCGEPKRRPDLTGPPFLVWLSDIKQPRVDIQAALTVIGQRPSERVAFEADRGLVPDLSGANLQRSRLTGMFARANLLGAHLERAQLYGAHLERAQLYGAHLEGAGLNETHLEGAQLGEAHLEGAVLNETHLQGAFLGAAHLEDASLVAAHLEDAILNMAHLEGAALNMAHLEGAHLDRAHLEGAMLNMAHLEGAHLDGAHLEGAQLFDTDLSKVVDLDPDSLATALGDATTMLPEGMARPATWPDREIDETERNAWRAQRTDRR